ncbi:MAG: hypothetical protein HON65_09355 [Rhodospirillales bacterium]|jgi:propanediol dehydratase large subunit|nr:hypothetical protein [Rhodospirillales bacterium]
MTDAPSFNSNLWKRFSDWDERPLRLDQFAIEDPDRGFSAFSGTKDPQPSITLENGAITSMDGVSVENFDMIDEFIACHHLDLEVAEEAMAMSSSELARMLVDMNVPRVNARVKSYHCGGAKGYHFAR